MTSSCHLVLFDCCLPPRRGRMEPNLPSTSAFCCSYAENGSFPILVSYTFQSWQPSFRFGDGLLIEYGKGWGEVAHPWEKETPGWSGWLADIGYLGRFFPSLDSRIVIPVKIMARNFIIYFINWKEVYFQHTFRPISCRGGGSLKRKLSAYCLFKKYHKMTLL